jgi:hypothetical protein
MFHSDILLKGTLTRQGLDGGCLTQVYSSREIAFGSGILLTSAARATPPHLDPDERE